MNRPTETLDPYQRESGSWKEPPVSIFGMMGYWGPGLILTASVVGSGELIATTGLGAKAGFVALWLILLSCVIKVPIQLILGRYTIYSGKTTLHFLNELPGPRLGASWFVWLWMFVLLIVGLQQGAMLGGVAMVLNLLIPQVPINAWAVLVTLVTIALLRRGRYSLLEHASMIMVAVFTVTTILCIGMLQRTRYGVTNEDIASGLAFSLPTGGMSVAVAMFGITGVGATELMFYPYVCLEKGYARCTGAFTNTDAWYARAAGWIRTMHWDALLSMFIYTVLTVSFYLLGAAVLHARSVVPEGMGMVRNLSLMYTETLGERTRLVFLAGALFALYSTVFVSTAAKARMLTDCFELVGWARIERHADRQKWVKALVTIMPMIQILLFFAFQEPLWMVVVGGTTQTISLIAIAIGALYVRHVKLDKGLKPSLASDALIWISAICIVLVAVVGLLMKEEG